MTKNQENVQTRTDRQGISRKELRYMCFKIMMINILEELKDKFDNFGISY